MERKTLYETNRRFAGCRRTFIQRGAGMGILRHAGQQRLPVKLYDRRACIHVDYNWRGAAPLLLG